ncbi:hypothetical protein D3C79_934870 [compost metagenome]
MAPYQLVGDRAADHARGNQADGVAGDAQFMCIADAELLDEQRSPGQCCAHPAGQGNRAHHQARLGIQAKHLGQAHAQGVLQDDEDTGEHQQDH